MKKQKILEQAIRLAANAHRDQYDKGGKPYILHPLAVLRLVNSDDEEINCIAVMHDIIEDTSVSEDILREQGFSERVIAGVVALTKVRGQTYDEYKKAVFANRDAMKVKMADLLHNSDLRRLKDVTEKDIARTEKYMSFYKELKDKLNENTSDE